MVLYLVKKKLFSKILKSLHAPLFRICLGQIIGKQSSDALICNFIQISLSGWQISKFKHLKSHWGLLPDTTLASLCIVISLKSTLFRASWSLGFGLWTAFGFCLTFGLTFSLGFSLTFGLGFGFGRTLGLALLAKLIKELGTSVSNSSSPGKMATKKPESPGFMSASSTTPALPGMLLTMQPRVASNQDFSNFSTLVGKWTLLPSSSEDNTSKAALALMHLLWLLLWEEPSTDAYKDCTAAAEGRDLRGVAAVVVLLFLAGDAALLEVSDFSSEAKQKTEKKQKKKKEQELMAVKKPFWDFFWFCPQ